MTQIEIAKAIAVVAHRGQVDKAGEPYIYHPERVAANLHDYWKNNESRAQELVATAWLHDVLEDTTFSAADLINAGVQRNIVEAVGDITRRKNEPGEEYYERVRLNWIALRVKEADIADNLNPNRLARLDDETIVRLTKKYAKARVLLKLT